jgi:hypothetical protein
VLADRERRRLPKDPRREAAMPKRWKVAAVTTMTDLDTGDVIREDEPRPKEYEEEERAKADRKFDKVKGAADRAMKEKD